MSTPTLNVKIINPDQTLYNGPASSVTSFNHKGKFDILPSHIHFISLISNELILQLPNDLPSKKYDLTIGVIRVYDNEVEIYIGL